VTYHPSSIMNLEIDPTTGGPIQIRAEEPPRAVCKHLGKFKRLEDCEPCGTNTHLKVFHCPLHNECTIQVQIPSIKCCRLCEDYNPIT
jgi:hypothetical protein